MNKTLKAVLTCGKIELLHQLSLPKGMKEAGLTPQVMFEELLTDILLSDDVDAKRSNQFQLSCLDVFCSEMARRKEGLDLSRLVTLFDAAYSNYRKHSVDHFRSLSKEDQVKLEPLFVSEVQPNGAIPILLILNKRMPKFDINVQDSAGHTILMVLAANPGCYDAMSKALDLGANMQIESKKHGKAIHMVNPASNSPEIAKKIDLLVAKGVNLNEPVTFKPLDELSDTAFPSYADYVERCVADLKKSKAQFGFNGTRNGEYILNLCEVQKGAFEAINRTRVAM